MYQPIKFKLNDLADSCFPKEFAVALDKTKLVVVNGLDQLVFDEADVAFEELSNNSGQGLMELGIDIYTLNPQRTGVSKVTNLRFRPKYSIHPSFLQTRPLLAAYEALTSVMSQLESAIARYYDLDLRSHNNGKLLFLKYPVANETIRQRFKPHFDRVSFIQAKATVEGYRAYIDGRWRKINLDDGEVFFQPGELLSGFTNGKIEAVRHKVIPVYDGNSRRTILLSSTRA